MRFRTTNTNSTDANLNDTYCDNKQKSEEISNNTDETRFGIVAKIGFGLLFLIPIIGCYAISHYAFSNENPHLKKYASFFFDAFWIIVAISIVLGLTLFLILWFLGDISFY